MNKSFWASRAYRYIANRIPHIATWHVSVDRKSDRGDAKFWMKAACTACESASGMRRAETMRVLSGLCGRGFSFDVDPPLGIVMQASRLWIIRHVRWFLVGKHGKTSISDQHHAGLFAAHVTTMSRQNRCEFDRVAQIPVKPFRRISETIWWKKKKTWTPYFASICRTRENKNLRLQLNYKSKTGKLNLRLSLYLLIFFLNKTMLHFLIEFLSYSRPNWSK